MNSEFNKKKYRERFVEAFIRQGIALQIQMLRKREGWSQKKLGELTSKRPNAITRLEDPSYGKFTITTLLELAQAFDVALSVRFIPFSELERQSLDLSQKTLTVARYKDENPNAVRRTSRVSYGHVIDANKTWVSVRSGTDAKLNLKVTTSPKDSSIIHATGTS